MKDRKLTRCKNSILFGVCSGIAKYFDIDPVIVRLIAILLTCSGCFGFFGYILLTLIIPREDEE